MKLINAVQCGIIIICCFNNNAFSQQQTDCKVEMPSIGGSYIGDCKNGYAHGKGEAKGWQRYTGQFKFGLPNGQGTFYYCDSIYHTGNFQDGIKEGKGTTYYVRAGKPDSVIKGYWSADIYRGKAYKTYQVSDMPPYDRVDITPSDEPGKTLTIETATNSGSIAGSVGGQALTVNDVVALDGGFIRKLDVSGGLKYLSSWEITKFPVRLRVMLSDGRAFNIELYKAAKWKIYIFLNK
jgi:hypothetical protein